MSKEVLGYYSWRGFIPFVDKEYSVESSFKAPEIKNLKRQGNLCVLNFQSSVPTLVGGGVFAIIIPSDACPNKETNIIATYHDNYYNDNGEVDFIHAKYVELTIPTNGVIECRFNKEGDKITNFKIVNACWETAVK